MRPVLQEIKQLSLLLALQEAIYSESMVTRNDSYKWTAMLKFYVQNRTATASLALARLLLAG